MIIVNHGSMPLSIVMNSGDDVSQQDRWCDSCVATPVALFRPSDAALKATDLHVRENTVLVEKAHLTLSQCGVLSTQFYIKCGCACALVRRARNPHSRHRISRREGKCVFKQNSRSQRRSVLVKARWSA